MGAELQRGQEGRARGVLAGTLGAIAIALASAAAAPAAWAAAPPMPAYMPTEMVHSILTPAQVGVVLGELREYSFNEALLQIPHFNKKGRVKLPASNATMLGVWASETAAFDAEQGTAIRPVAVFNAVPKPGGLNLEDPATRARMLAGIEAVLGKGIGAVQLDIEPYPTGGGYIALLESIDAALARRGISGGLSVVAPGETATWSPSYTRRVAELVGEIDPTFYDSEITDAAGYEEWIEQGMAHMTANVPGGTAIVPVIPSYGPNPWHDPAVESIADASLALRASLAQGDRVNGAGLWWWYGFYEEENRHYRSAADRAAWLEQTLALPFSA